MEEKSHRSTMSSKICLLLVLVVSVSASTCPAKIKCTQGVDSDYRVVIWNAVFEAFGWSKVVESNDNSDLCVIGFNQHCEIKMFGAEQSSFPNRDSGCQYHEKEQMVFCVCRDSHYCNMAPDHYAAFAKQAFIGAGIDISHNCPAAFEAPAEFIPPTAC